MKKYLAMLLACAMIFAFAAGCAQQNPANSDEPTATNAPTGVEATPVQNTELVTDGNETVSDKDTINIAVDREPAPPCRTALSRRNRSAGGTGIPAAYPATLTK